jgi:3-oxoacyl-[acyl-carrier protein] reductase
VPRPKKCRRVCDYPQTLTFLPEDHKNREQAVILTVDEYETIRLIDKEGLSQEQCGDFMQVARTTVQQIYAGARKKLADVLVDGLPLRIEGGDYQLCSGDSQGCGCTNCYKQKFNQQHAKPKGEHIMRIAVTYENGGILMRLKDKVAIITGGSRGIGYATADKFLKEGATVILTASSQGSADKAVAQLKEKYPDATVAGISPNLSNLESVLNAFREAASKYGCIDILVNNAGVSESTPFTEYTEETFDKVMDLNVKGVFNATRAASECMIAKGNGVILSTSSMVSIYGQPSGFAYPASKFAVNGLTVSLARELGPKGIRVNAVAPGITLTDMMKAVPKEVIDPLIKQIPLRRLGQPEDIANAFVFLASDEASYITGVVLSVDGMART